MTASILVATPHPAFGELLRTSLEENGKYRVHVSLSAREARASSLHGVFQLAILDFALTDEPFIPLCFDLLDQQKGLRLVVVPPENNPNHPALGGLMPHGYLSRPFYLPDLLDTVTRLLDERVPSPAAGLNGHTPGRFQAGKPAILSYTLPAWLADPLLLEKYLDQQLPQTQALAALVGVSDPTPGSGILHASAGKLSQAAAQEMTGIVFRYWNRSKKADLMRFVRLNSEKQDFLIYATPLASDLVLTLIYDTSSPLSQVRPQTKAVAQVLANQPPEGFQAAGQETALETSPESPSAGPEMAGAAGEHATETAENVSTQAGVTGPLDPAEASPGGDTPAGGDNLATGDVPAGGDASASGDAPSGAEIPAKAEPYEPVKSAAHEPETQPLDDPFLFEPGSPAAGAESPAIQTEPTPADIPASFKPETDEEGESPVINLSALLGSIPQPDPSKETPDPFNTNWMTNSPSLNARQPSGFNGWQPANGFEFERTDERAPEPSQEPEAPARPESQTEAIPDWVMNPPQDSVSDQPAPVEPAASAGVEEAVEEPGDMTGPETAEAEGQLVLGNEPAIDPLEDTRPRVLSAISNLNQLEPVSPALSLLNYTCVLVPRLPQHYLTGELADRLSHWVQQLCLAFGWRLEGISVRPEYLQWTLQVAPSVSPGNLVRIIRQRTSINIFSHFANLAEQNPSGDFWATGYLIVSGSQPPSAQLLRDYISQTRKRQGIGR